VSRSLQELIDELLAAYKELHGVLARRLGNVHEADDVAQTSFERVYAHMLTASSTAPRALLFRTAQRICIDRARHQAVMHTWLEESARLSTHGAVPAVEHIVLQRQLAELVLRRLARLPARRREVFFLFHAHGYSRREIAQRLGITEATVAKHLMRATFDCTRCCADLQEM
jgi:RNA polymerase sigma-70 factor (ECF subfamily)